MESNLVLAFYLLIILENGVILKKVGQYISPFACISWLKKRPLTSMLKWEYLGFSVFSVESFKFVPVSGKQQMYWNLCLIVNVHASTFIMHCVRLHSAAYLHKSAVRAPHGGKQERAIQSWAAALRRAHAMGSVCVCVCVYIENVS